MSSRNAPDSATSEQSQSVPTPPVQPDPQVPQSSDATCHASTEPMSVFASVHVAIASMREDARTRARQMIADAEHALLESLRVLHASEKSSPTADDAGSATEQGGQQ